MRDDIDSKRRSIGAGLVSVREQYSMCRGKLEIVRALDSKG